MYIRYTWKEVVRHNTSLGLVTLIVLSLGFLLYSVFNILSQAKYDYYDVRLQYDDSYKNK